MLEPSLLKSLLAWLFLATAAVAAGADEFDAMLKQAHPWARFGQGSWRHVRVITQNFDEQGKATDSSVADNKTTVVEVTADRVTLEVAVTVEVAGQQFPSEPQTIVQSYVGESLGENVTVKPLEPLAVSIDNREIRCERRQIEIAGGVTREVSQIAFVAEQEPAILRRESKLSDASGDKQLQEIVSQVMALNMSRLVLNESEPKPAYLVRSTQTNDRGTTVTWSWHVPEVPGEVVDQCSHKTDEKGNVVRRTTLELIGYGISDVEEVETGDGRRTKAASRRIRRQQRRGNQPRRGS